MKTAVLLFCHGARDPNWARPFEAVLARIRELHPDMPVALAFLEFMSPGLIEAGHTLAAAGCDSVEVVPLFLGTGGHVRKDLPALLDNLRLAHPQVSWSVQPSIGESPCVIAAMADAALAALQGVRASV
jgi:sirohydrochlorin cobaltochelatase